MDQDAYKVCRLVGPRARQILDVFDLGAHGRADLSQQSPYLIEPLRGATPCRTAPGRGGARPRRLACAGPRRAHRRSTRAGRNPVWLVATRGGPGTLAPVRQPIQELGAGTPLGHRQFDRSGPRDPPRSIAVAGVRACTALRACAARRRPRQPRLTAFVGFRVLVLREIAGPHQGCVV
jgi:hypothetical protein